jgi:aspartate/methionine/tyrosine aminotransferase
MQRLRPAVGVTPQAFVQRASVVAWGDEEHVGRARERYARKRALFLELFARKGIAVAGSEGTFYLWVEVPDGRGSAAWADELLAQDIVVAPGAFFGPEGEGYVRMAMVPSFEDCERAAGILDALLPDGAAVA